MSKHEAPKDAKTLKLEEDYKKLKTKRAIYQGHLKAVGQVGSSEEAANTLVQFVLKHQAGDQLYDNRNNNYTKPLGGGGYVSMLWSFLLGCCGVTGF